MIHKNWIKNLPENPLLAVKMLAEKMIEWDQPKTNRLRMENYESYLDFYAFMENYSEKNRLAIHFPPLSENPMTSINRIVEFVYRLKETINRRMTQVMFENSRSDYSGEGNSKAWQDILGTDRGRIQHQINMLRQLIMESLFADDLKKRLLKKLNNLQYTLDSEITFLDRLYQLFE